MIDCEDLKQLETGEMGEALTWIVNTSERHAECRAKVKAWIKVKPSSEGLTLIIIRSCSECLERNHLK